MKAALVITCALALLAAGCTREQSAAPSPPPPSRGPLHGTSASGGVQFKVELRPAAPALGELFEAVVEVTALDGGAADLEAFSLDATMPHHGHGMVTQPEHEPVAKGRFRTRGLKLHMPGEWTFTVRARVDGRPEEAHLLFRQAPGGGR